jgi:hypothetical protein
MRFFKKGGKYKKGMKRFHEHWTRWGMILEACIYFNDAMLNFRLTKSFNYYQIGEFLFTKRVKFYFLKPLIKLWHILQTLRGKITEGQHKNSFEVILCDPWKLERKRIFFGHQGLISLMAKRSNCLERFFLINR